MRSPKLRNALLAGVLGALTLSGSAFAAEKLHASTRQDLSEALHGEAFAYLKYLTYADQARGNGNEQLARTFEKTAATERRHFAEHAELARIAGSDTGNLRDAIAGEDQENTKTYPDMAKRAAGVWDRKAAEHFREVASDEGRHRDDYRAVLRKLTSGASTASPSHD
jgi:rubrerythrin